MESSSNNNCNGHRGKMPVIKSTVFNNANHHHNNLRSSVVSSSDNTEHTNDQQQQQFYEKDLKVDKKILEVMYSGGNDNHPSWDYFLSKISSETNVKVEVSTSIKDRQGNEIPVLKLKSMNQKQLEVASALIMERLDPHRDKMTFNIDVPYSDHSYIIGKDGVRIKHLSKITGCHIHLPDCNKTSNKKSNKLSIAGMDFNAIDKARDQIRKSLPLNIGFKAQIKSEKFVIIDTASAEVQAVKRKYRVDVTFTNVIANTKYPEVTINVKGGRAQLEDIEAATNELYHYATEEKLINNPNVIFTITIDVSHSHHQYVRGKNNCNLKVINQRSGAMIIFPSNDSSSNQVLIQSKNLLSTVMGWQELMGYLPLLLSFDVNFDITHFNGILQKMEKEYGVGIRTREKLAGHVYTISIKTQERHSTYLQEIRQKIFALNNHPEVSLNKNNKPTITNGVLANATNQPQTNGIDPPSSPTVSSTTNNNLPNFPIMNFIPPSQAISVPTPAPASVNYNSNYTSNILQPLLKNNTKTSPMMMSNFSISDDLSTIFDQENCKMCTTNRTPLGEIFGNNTGSNSSGFSDSTTIGSSSSTHYPTYDPFKFTIGNFNLNVATKATTQNGITETSNKLNNICNGNSNMPQMNGSIQPIAKPTSSGFKWPNANSPACISNESGIFGLSYQSNNLPFFKYFETSSFNESPKTTTNNTSTITTNYNSKSRF